MYFTEILRVLIRMRQQCVGPVRTYPGSPGRKGSRECAYAARRGVITRYRVISRRILRACEIGATTRNIA